MQLQLASAVESITTQLSALGARLHQQDEQFTERLSLFEGQLASLAGGDGRSGRLDSMEASDYHADSDSGSGGSSDLDSLASSLDSGDGKDYIRVPKRLGLPMATERHADADQRPHRYSLHGNEVYDKLCTGKRGDGGTLGFAMRHLEPTRLYLKTGLQSLRSLTRELARQTGPDDDFTAELRATFNTLEGAFDLLNQFATLIVERAKVVSPGAKKADKQRQEWVESQLESDANPATDTHKAVRKLKARYDYEAGKADLRRAANSGGATSSSRSGGLDRGSDDEQPRRSRSAKRRERRQRAGTGHSGGDRGGGRRDESRRSRGATSERPRRREDSESGSDHRGENRRRSDSRQERSSATGRAGTSRGGRRDEQPSTTRGGGSREQRRERGSGRGGKGSHSKAGKGGSRRDSSRSGGSGSDSSEY